MAAIDCLSVSFIASLPKIGGPAYMGCRSCAMAPKCLFLLPASESLSRYVCRPVSAVDSNAALAA